MQPQVKVPLEKYIHFVLIYLHVVPDPSVVSVGKQKKFIMTGFLKSKLVTSCP